LDFQALTLRLASTCLNVLGPQRLRPGYLIVGTKRGGSTSLASWVAEHPNVAPLRKVTKGTHFFDVNYGRGRAWYFSCFERADRGWTLTGEASPYYMYHPAAPQRIAATLPAVKLIAVLRDPIERLWSHYQYEVARGNECEPLESALRLEPQRLAGEKERLLSDVSYPGFAFRHFGYLERGHYAEQLERIYKHFPHEQVHVIRSEDLFSDPHGELTRLWRFLGIADVELDDLPAQNQGAVRAEIEPAIREWLIDYYRPHNERLYEMTGIDFS
jgi:Sulfotransferase domain